MIKLISGKYSKHIAWFLFFVFYGELAVSVYAGGGSAGYTAYHRPARQAGLFFPLTPTTPVVVNSKQEFPAVEKSPVEIATQPAATAINDEPVSNDGIDKVDIDGPGQPEMSSFKPVGADNMVNLFTGDFSYNIPLADVGGFPINLFYNAGISMEQEASWVGLGWNINPGTISRNMRGLPDDYNGVDVVTKTQSMKPDRTIGVSAAGTIENFGLHALDLTANVGVFYNNRRGLGLETGVNLDYSIYKRLEHKVKDEKSTFDTLKKTTLSGGLDLNSQNGMSFNGGFSITQYNLQKHTQSGMGTSVNISTRQGLTDFSVFGEYQKYKPDEENKKYETALSLKHRTTISFARSSFTPSIRVPISRMNQTYTLKLGKASTGRFKHLALTGYIQESKIASNDRTQKKPAYGFMYYDEANEDKDALLDFNRVNDGVYSHKTPVLALPVYTYDVYSINGEGTGGSFRGYRGNMGYMRDHESQTRSGSFSIAAELGFKNLFHGGTILNGVYTPSYVNEWKSGNTLSYASAFNKTDSIYQSFYFKNPGEKAIIDQNYYQAMGADQLIRPYLGGTNTATPYLRSSFQVYDKNREIERTIPVTAANSYRAVRDKRTQVITWLTAKEADHVGLDKYIYSYTENSFLPGSCDDPAIRTKIRRYNPNDPTFYRKEHHISEMDVTEGNGQRYIYGIPAYQIKQKEVTFSIEDRTPDAHNLVSYNPGDDNSVNNENGRDGFYQSETMDGYAHSYLLTGILSPDYVDVSGDGITDDDLGTAIKLNYSRINKVQAPDGTNYWQPYKWRTPIAAGKASFNEGLQADPRDDKALYTYGEKEIWYLHSIESKNMVATFRTSSRFDGSSASGEDGGLGASNGLRKLDRIDIYTKADYVKNGGNATPIQTIHFDYKYTLCPDYAGNSNGTGERGKLTLNAVWKSYRGHTNQVKNKYVFKYANTKLAANDANPSYNPTENDRWGTYKPYTENPDDMKNGDYPYTIQNQQKSDIYASAWNLEQILLPGGAIMKIDYEADDYAYVQDKRACQMTDIVGFSSSSSGTGISNKLYTYNALNNATPGLMDHRYVYFTATEALTTPNQIREKYLQDMKQLLLKLWVKMPKGNVGNPVAYEPVVVYGVIKSYGVNPLNSNQFYIELEPTRKNGSPIMETIMQFLKDQLPARAYPGYEVNGDGALAQVVRAVFGLVNAFTQGVMGFEKDLKLLGKCKEVQLNRSFARLNNPLRKKIGGGYRVKKITVKDNWNTMTTQYDAEYGQSYDYTTTEEINGQPVTISSGVAAYEPGVGNEENPFREVLKYEERQFLGPTDHNNVELPIAETFFPSPMVGYSKVKVRSIHNKETKSNKNIKSGIGMQETEFYTTRDFPVIAEFTSFDHQSRKHHAPGVIQRVLNFDKRDYLTLTQGFRIVLNDMNGKMKSQTSYAENDLVNPVNFTANYYRTTPRGSNKFKLDNLLPVISGPDGTITDKIIGKDIEVMNDFREHFSYTRSANIPLNLDIFKIGTFPAFVPTLFRLAFRDETMFRSGTTLKVVNEFGILDSVVNIDKGSKVSTKNLVYDAETGNPLITRTNNEFDKFIYTFSYPAWWSQSGMEPAYRNIDLTYKGVTFRSGRIENSPQVNMEHFESGDEIYVTHNSEAVQESPGCIAGSYPSKLAANDEYRIWAVDIRKDERNTVKQFIFLDRYGNPYNATNATIRIIRSGKRNLIDASVGSLTSLASPVRNVSGTWKVVIDNNTNVINTAATEFKEKWRATDQFYAVDTIVRTVVQAPIYTTYVYVDNKQSFGEYYTRGDRYYDNIPNPPYFMAEQYNKDPFIGAGKDFRQRSWLKFDFPSGTFSAGVKIHSARLFATAHSAYHQININKNESPGAPVYTTDQHKLDDPHVSKPNHSNNFILSRMFYPTWPGSTEFDKWKYLYEYNPAPGEENIKIVQGTAPPISYANFNIDVTKLVTGMLRDKFALNYPTALRINLVQDDGNRPPARVCFWSENGVGGHIPSAPRMEVKYYHCNDPMADTIYSGVISGAPTTPPAGYEYCITDAPGRICYSVFTKKQMNPYIERVLGVFLPYRSYVYYGERRESDPTVATDIRKDGIIKDYESYWTLTSLPTDKLGKSGSTKWVWNSEITQYSRKGAELENHDPLNRYNCGIYGYQETLPIAVVNNSRLRLSAFDGFEDYSYKDDPCEPYCKPSKRHFNTNNPYLTDTESHTGRYSAVIAANQTYRINIPVSANDSIDKPDLLIQLDSTAHESVIAVYPKGVGLKGNYYNNLSYSGTPVVRSPEYPDLSFRKDKNGNGCRNRDADDPPGPHINCRDISVKWRGYIQVSVAGNYEFDIPGTDDEGYVCVVGKNDAYPDCADPATTSIWGGPYQRNVVPLTVGTHRIEICYKQYSGEGRILLLWKTPGSNTFTRIPTKNLYPDGQESLLVGSEVTATAYCVKPDTIQAINHHLIDSFNLIPGKRMVASVWMKKGGQDCKCTGYTNNFKLVIPGETEVEVASFVAKERIIEGWQQFEAVFTVPSSITQLQLKFPGQTDAVTYIDDLRIHPFNANMKSFVYDPVTLRLAAELDENNYAAFYEYDDDGGLIRVKKETRAGIKTINETRSATQKIITTL